jgi:hypothetical protein
MTGFKEFDIVDVLTPLTEPGGPTFAAGTRATIVDLGSDYAFVEIALDDGSIHGPFDVRLTDLRVVEHATTR